MGSVDKQQLQPMLFSALYIDQYIQDGKFHCSGHKVHHILNITQHSRLIYDHYPWLLYSALMINVVEMYSSCCLLGHGH